MLKPSLLAGVDLLIELETTPLISQLSRRSHLELGLSRGV